jgi:isopenicillin N synthase-like dioxygenase
MMTSDAVLLVDLRRYERGDQTTRAAVVDAVMRSLASGFVYVSHDLSEGLIDDAYGMLQRFFACDGVTKQSFVAPGSFGQTGYTGLLVETAATSDVADWKEMLNWSSDIANDHPLRRRYPHRYMTQVLPESAVPGISDLLNRFHVALFDVQRRFLRIIAEGLRCDPYLFDAMLTHGPTLSRAIHYPSMQQAPDAQHVWAGAHADINLITALPRATAPGLQLQTATGWEDVVAPPHTAIINSGMMLEHLTNGLIPAGVHRVVSESGNVGERHSVVQFCHPTPWTVLAPLASCITDERPQRYAAISAADRLDDVLWQINLTDG